MLEKNTTREHFEKYRDLAKKLHVTFDTGSDFMNIPTRCGLPSKVQHSGRCCWTHLFQRDPNLNNISLSRWDSYAISLKVYNPLARGLSIAESVCLAKHLVVYQLVGAVPIF